MVTLALAQCVYYLFYQAERWTGGENGLRGVNVRDDQPVRPDARLHRPADPSTTSWRLRRRRALACCRASWPRRSAPSWRRCARTRPARAPAATTWRRTSCWPSCCPAASAAWPARSRRCTCRSCRSRSLHYETSGMVVMMCLLGGMGTFFGPFVGAGAVPAARGPGLALDRALAARRRRRVHGCRAVLPARHLGHAAEPDETMSAPRPPVDPAHRRASARRSASSRRSTDVTAEFERGALTSIIGPNGAGKSTYFNMLSGAFAPTRGRVDIRGPRHHRPAAARVRAHRHRQVLPDHQRLSAAHRARERARRPAGASSPAIDIWRPRASLPGLVERADALLGDGRACSDRRDAPARDLAHGEQRALEIAMALAADPQLLLLDEPTAGMSPEETRVMMDLIVKLAGERTVILVEHKMKLVMGISERIMVLHHGELLAEGTPDEIRAERRGASASISASGSTEAMAPPMLQISKLNAWYGPSHVLQDISLQVGRGRDRLPDRPQRRRQDHHAESGDGPARPPRRLGRVRGRGDPEGCRRTPASRAAWPTCRRNAASCRA